MVKYSYRFSGSSFTGQRYTYLGPSSRPCNKISKPVDAEMVNSDNWSLSGDGAYVYVQGKNFVFQVESMLQITDKLLLISDPTHSVRLTTFQNYRLGTSVDYLIVNESAEYPADIYYRQIGCNVILTVSVTYQTAVSSRCYVNLYELVDSKVAGFISFLMPQLTSSLIKQSPRFSFYKNGHLQTHIDVGTDDVFRGKLVLHNDLTNAHKWDIPDCTFYGDIRNITTGENSYMIFMSKQSYGVFGTDHEELLNMSTDADPIFTITSGYDEYVYLLSGNYGYFSTFTTQQKCDDCKIFVY